MAKINITQKISASIVMMLALFFYSACGPSHKQEVDRLNTLSYAYHYRDLDSTKMLAQRALALSDDYSAGYAEACNNLAFVEMAKMNYKEARRWLGLVEEKSNNQLELLIADVQMSAGISQQRFLFLSRESDGAIAPFGRGGFQSATP